MEKRLILATVLSFIVLIGYQLLFVKPKMQAPAPPVQAEAEPAEASKAVPAAELPSEAAGETPVTNEKSLAEKAGQEGKPLVAAEYEQKVTVETSLYRAVFSNRGGTLHSLKLKEHLSGDGTDLELVNPKALELNRYPFSFWLEEKVTAEYLNSAFFRVEGGSIVLKDGETASVKFEYSDGKGISAVKVYRFTGGKYELGIELEVLEREKRLEPYLIWGPGISSLSPEELKHRFSAISGVAALSAGKVNRISEKKYKPEKSAFNFVDWAAYEDNYYVAMLVTEAGKGQAIFMREFPGLPEESAGTVEEPKAKGNPVFYLAVADPVKAYLGPKEIDRLKAFGHMAKKVINFGAFGAIAEVMLAVVRYFYKLVPNWGVAIILMTLIIKIIFFPLTYSSTKSMAKMAEIQPKLKALRAKYKKSKTDINQRKQMNEEMMKLYKEHGINPAGGCLPLLIQIPVFWGVFRMLVVSVELRHSPFIFWIKDLSVRDPYYVTPILMGVTQFIQQKMTPTSADPSQARMMLIMPFIMTIFFMNFQSGLVLYWLTQNVLQIGQQAIMNKLMAAKKRDTHGKRS